MNNFEIFWNPYSIFEGQPSHLARFIEYDKKYLCGWNIEYNLPILKHSRSVIEMADKTGYKLPIWVEVPDWLKKYVEDDTSTA